MVIPSILWTDMVFLWLFIIAVVTIILVVTLLMRYLKEENIRSSKKNTLLKKQMTSNIAHELRTPVTSIRGYLETLLACPDMPQEKKKVFLERAYNQTLRLSELISDMALISKIEEKSSNFKKAEIDFYDVAKEVFDEFSERTASGGITVENTVMPGSMMTANRTLIYSILRNLVENSLKYAGPQVTIHLESFYIPSDKCYYMTYYDTGAGVPEEHLERIFERFYRVSEGRTRDDGGSGLGLSIVRNAVAFHGGKIRVSNREEGGLQFQFTIMRG
ncbi:MAG: HAMP domain-containing histidine kinase [Bacteroidales bacterium]|nr:HAMP domain-containing histidine kinase [Bacteroidales bacterium]